ncbi:MAG: hypothetical protein OEL76_17600 [Siculibacillus sp.]|nr:hypothetical protein [Siculibacillus sp.]
MSRTRIAFAALLLTAAASVPARAQVEAPAMTEWQFGKSGNWNVLYLSLDKEGTRFGQCLMEQIYESEVALRIGIAGSNRLTIDYMGMASMENERPLPVRYYVDAPDQGTDVTAQALREGGQDAMWRRIEEALDEIGGTPGRLAKGKNLMIQSGSKRWSYALAGAAPAFESVKTCFRRYNPGKPLAEAGARPPAPPPVMAAPAAPPPAPAVGASVRSPFGQTKDWRIDKVVRGGNTVACIGQGSTPPLSSIRVVIDARSMHLDWQDGFTARGQRFPVKLGFGTDVAGYGDYHASVISDETGLWARISQTRSEPGFEDSLANSTQVWLQNPKNMFSVPLDGSNRMFDVFYRCMDTIK